MQADIMSQSGLCLNANTTLFFPYDGFRGLEKKSSFDLTDAFIIAGFRTLAANI